MMPPTKTIEDLFPRRILEAKPRKTRQTWLKDVGFDEGPWYIERMGLTELQDFLEVAAPRLDFVKITTSQVLFHPSDWVRRKICLYQAFEIEPYLDHTYFVEAFRRGAVEDAIVAGAELGFKTIEFMNTFGDVSSSQWRDWRQSATDCGMRIIYEHHPERNWRNVFADRPSTADEILRGAEPFLNHGAFTLLLDHEELELHSEHQGLGEIAKITESLGQAHVVFEVTSPKEGHSRWIEDLENYFGALGSEINVSNIMPSQAMHVEALRTGERSRSPAEYGTPRASPIGRDG